MNVYLPDELAAQARAAGLNVSSLAQAAVRRALAAGRTDVWLDDLARLPATGVSHAEALLAVAEARDDLRKK